MSSNNQLIILKNKKGKIEVHENPCMDDEFEPSKESFLKAFNNLDGAIFFASDYCKKEQVEYGYIIDDSCIEGNSTLKKSISIRNKDLEGFLK